MNLGKESKRMRSLYSIRRRARKTEAAISNQAGATSFPRAEVFLNYGRADSICLKWFYPQNAQK